ncbi:hypothetical protein MJD09_15950 [bacterium]|nr:hypothetical protein [bacterium]
MSRSFMPSDLYRFGLWSIVKVCYAVLPIPLLFWWAGVRGSWHSRASGQRSTVKRNLASAYGSAKNEKEIDAIVQRHYRYLKRMPLSKIWPKLQRFAYASQCDIEGLNHLDSALREGKGVILLVTKFGYPRLIKPLLRRRNYPVLIVGPTMKEKPRPLTAFGSFLYYKLLRMPEFSRLEDNDIAIGLNVRPLVQALGQNKILILTVDGLRSSNLMKMSFLGGRTVFSGGAFSLARMTGARILPTFAVESDHGLIAIKVCIETPLELVDKGDPKRDDTHMLQQYASIYESYVHRWPHLFYWMGRHLYAKKQHRALKAKVENRYDGQFKVRRQDEQRQALSKS